MFSTLSTSSKAKEKTLLFHLRKRFLDSIPLKNLLMTFPGSELIELRKSEAKTNFRFQWVWKGKERVSYIQFLCLQGCIYISSSVLVRE